MDKFCCFQALLVTKQFKDQQSTITSVDWMAWYEVVVATQSFGFYNSDLPAGASQKHKHFQIIPFKSISEYKKKATGGATAATVQPPVLVQSHVSPQAQVESQGQQNVDDDQQFNDNKSNNDSTNSNSDSTPLGALITHHLVTRQWIPFDPFQLG